MTLTETAMSERFQPAWWCRNPHLQTLWPVFFRRGPRPALRRERLELPDGDFVDLDWTGNQDGPIVILLHGLEGSRRSHYARALLARLPRAGMRGVLMHFRGCSGVPNRLARAYHSGDTGDLAFLVQTLQQREPATPLAAVGYSLGGNVLLKWLGQGGAHVLLRRAAAVSVPLVLHESTRRMERGFSRVYQWHLLGRLRRSLARKARHVDTGISAAELRRLRSFYAFDDRVTAPLHGFTDAMHYYTASSARQFLGRIRVPTLVVQAADDPFMSSRVLPRDDELSPSVQFELQRHGGHVGFVGGTWPWRPRYWLEERLLRWLAAGW
jgi:predicted alpha/beta-fold hydrolase